MENFKMVAKTFFGFEEILAKELLQLGAQEVAQGVRMVRFKGDKIADTVYKGFKALQAQDIADIIYFVISRPYHVNIADLLVFPTAQANSITVKKSK